MGKYVDTATSLATFMIGTTFDTATTNLGVKCIQWAEAEIDKYLSRRYDLSASPFTTSTATPPIVKSLCEQLSTGYMHRNMSRGGSDSMERADKFIEPVIKNLELIAGYELAVADSTGAIVSELSTTGYRVLSNTDDYATTFDEDDPLDWKIDKDKLDDIDSGRD